MTLVPPRGGLPSGARVARDRSCFDTMANASARRLRSSASSACDVTITTGEIVRAGSAVQRFEHLPSIGARHHQVQDHDVGMPLGRRLTPSSPLAASVTSNTGGGDTGG